MRLAGLVATTVVGLGAIGSPVVQAQQGSAVPVLVELFTSEGCSSCPPADAWLEQLDASQPIAGAQLIVLSEHVDYWNHDGWKDPYSSAAMTERQESYVKALGLGNPYTPEAVVDGKTELHLDRPGQVSQALSAAMRTAPVRVSILPVKVSEKDPLMLQAHIDVDGADAKRGADVFAAVALNHAESRVLHGENGGRRLKHVAVVEQLVKVGKLEKGKAFSKDFETKLPAGVDRKNLRLVAFVQEADQGAIVGSAMQRVEADVRQASR